MSEDGEAKAAAAKEEGNALFKEGKYALAIDAYTRSLDMAPNQHLCYSNRSAAYLKLGERGQEALQDARRCVELAPDWAKGYSRLCAALQDLRRWDEAKEACEQGLAKAPDDASLKKMAAEVGTRRFSDQIRGMWHGQVHPNLGGYGQEMEFMNPTDVRIEVLGRSVVGKYWLDCSYVPHHLNIQVPMQDVPPGMPPPPPVPYIAKLDDAGLHICCPVMRMDRPTGFSGDGYCLMTQGGLPKANATEVAGLSREEKLLQCSRELISVFPDRKLEEPSPSDNEEVAREKLIQQVKFESAMYAVQERYGEDVMKEVLGAAQSGAQAPAGLAGSNELSNLVEKLRMCGILDQQAAAPGGASAVPSGPAPSRGPTPGAEPRQAPEASDGDKASGLEPPASEESSILPLALGGLAVLAAAATAFALWKKRRSS